MIKFIKFVRSYLSQWIATPTVEQFQLIREHELSLILPFLPNGAKILEIGAGAGWQSLALKNKGFDIVSVDIKSSNYIEERVFNVIDYDGENLPFEDLKFDVVFTSNTLEHISRSLDFQNEISRVLNKNGMAIHVMPSSTWRIWTNFAFLIKYWTIPSPHGEHASNCLSEIYYFSRMWWRRIFSSWHIIEIFSNDLFYTGELLMDRRLSMKLRQMISFFAGGSCHVWILKKK